MQSKWVAWNNVMLCAHALFTPRIIYYYAGDPSSRGCLLGACWQIGIILHILAVCTVLVRLNTSDRCWRTLIPLWLIPVTNLNTKECINSQENLWSTYQSEWVESNVCRYPSRCQEPSSLRNGWEKSEASMKRSLLNISAHKMKQNLIDQIWHRISTNNSWSCRVLKV